MNLVKGHIHLKGTKTGISGLVVQAFDIQGEFREAESIVPRLNEAGFAGALGSTITRDGDFAISYEDGAFRIRTAERSRPDLLLLVLSPEEPGRTVADRVLYQADVRRSAAQQEFFSIQLDGKDLQKREVALPELQDSAAGQPKAIALKAATELERRREIRKELGELAKSEVAEARELERKMESQLQQRILQHLTQLSPDSPAWERFVPPGGDVRSITRESHQRTITRVINKAAAQETYLVLSDEEFQDLLDANGDPITEKVEAKLRGQGNTPSRLRDDPLLKECLVHEGSSPFDPPPPPEPPAPEPTEPQIEDLDIDRQLSRLFDKLQPPESISVPEGVRPDQNSVDVSVGKLSLRRGPADVPALYDFHNLQIAFDHVWEDARAEGVIEAAKVLYRDTLDAGGDPESALESQPSNPLRALAREAAVAGKAKGGRFVTTMARMNDEFGVPDIGPGIVVDPLPPQPPQPDPPRPHGGRPEWGGLDVNAVFEQASEGYPFTIFAAGSVNFGILVTYRQRWDPVSYQVGRLVKTLTLAPKEMVSFTTRQVVKLSMSQKQINSAQQMRKDDAEDTQRDEAEIVQRAESKTNFSLSASGSYDLGPLGEGDSTTTFGKDAASSSQETKKSFRQAVRKASQEFRDERKMEVETAQSLETEETTKREISNPNDELPVTYLFYELQRRYTVCERLFRVTPLVLVGQYVPPPEHISETWVMRHDWIIRRFLLDDSFLPALNYLATRVHGDRMILNDLKANLDIVRNTVNALKDEIMHTRAQMSARYAALEAQIEKQAQIAEEEESEGFFEKAGEALFYDSDESKEATRIREDAARDAYERAVREEKDLRSRLEREVSALQVASDTYTKALAENTNHQVQINRLVRHVRDYILHYMQGIWSYEHPDQRFFRHHTLEAPRLLPRIKKYTLEELNDCPVGVTPQPGKKCYRVTFTMELDENLDEDDNKATLAELAKLDEPQGFKGNYIIYPLKEGNALTDFMMTPYIDAELGLRDPDGTGNFTLDEFSRYVACLREKLGEDFSEVEPELRKQYEAILADPLRDGEEIIVPTNSLYIEALVGTQPLIEDFKLLHRGLDVLKVQAEARNLELENLRKAARIQSDKLGDPNVENVKNVYYRGDIPPHDGDE
ncbi:MAG: hypothetical protein ACR2M4_02405 [Actinomycetota bacterium]